jgi:hypothetical protein
MFNLEFEFVQEPFPHIVIDNFLDNELLESLNKDFPLDLVRNSEMPGRKKFSKRNKIHEKIVLSNSWEQFLSLLDNKAFVMNLMKKSKSTLSEHSRIDFSKPIKFYESQTYQKDPNCFFLDYDISEASTGYQREIHHDNDNRLISFLYHLNDADISGGRLGIFESTEDTVHSRQNPKNVNLKEFIDHKKNRMIIFVSNKVSYHSVEQITDCKVPRRFVYGAITHCGPGVWK